jgi:shikimate dehydrogenase
MMDARCQSSFLVGLIGSALQASLTPAMHEREADENGLRYLYRLIDIEKLGLGVEAVPELLTAAERMGFAGVNITHPCKQLIIPLLHELSGVARALGAVNTIVLSDGRRIGHNTDWWGFAESFRRDVPDVKRERVVQLGAGGAGAAVAHAALTLGVAQLMIVDTDRARGRARRGGP